VDGATEISGNSCEEKYNRQPANKRRLGPPITYTIFGGKMLLQEPDVPKPYHHQNPHHYSKPTKLCSGRKDKNPSQ